MIAVVALIVMVTAEVVGYVHNHDKAAQSWDQANLKRHDNGCPTAIYRAPNGILEQCP